MSNNTLIPLHPHTNIFGIEVPEDATENEAIFKALDNDYVKKGRYKMLGTVKNKAIDFDCEPYVQHHISYPQYFKDYNEGLFDDGSEDYYKRANGSFISLMESNNLDLTKHYVILKQI